MYTYIKYVDGVATIIPNVDTLWDEANYCTPEKLLADGRGDLFGVLALASIDDPQFDPTTHKVVGQKATLENGTWKLEWELAPLTAEELQQQIAAKIAMYESALDAHLDKVASLRRYDSRVTAALRAGYVGPYQAECIQFAQWMDACNVQAFALLGQVLAGQVALPTIPEFIESLPKFTWPGSTPL